MHRACGPPLPSEGLRAQLCPDPLGAPWGLCRRVVRLQGRPVWSLFRRWSVTPGQGEGLCGDAAVAWVPCTRFLSQSLSGLWRAGPPLGLANRMCLRWPAHSALVPRSSGELQGGRAVFAPGRPGVSSLWPTQPCTLLPPSPVSACRRAARLAPQTGLCWRSQRGWSQPGTHSAVLQKNERFPSPFISKSRYGNLLKLLSLKFR